MNTPNIVVGAGITGATIARRIAEDSGRRVTVIDVRDHIGGNCHSSINSETGIEYHCYGTHIFHTASKRVWNFINRFSSFNSYRHKVLTTYQGRTYHMPVNLQTINLYFGLQLRPCDVEEFIRNKSAAENISNPKNLEEKAVSLIGRELYEAFVKGYTLKQWGTDPKNLPAEIISRLPFRHSHECDYFTDPYQGIPIDGYDSLFKKMLNHKLIDVQLGQNFFDIKDSLPDSCRIFYTGPIDRYFDFKFGELGWRSLRFESEVVDVPDYQGTSVMNFADIEVPYTRIHEWRHLHPERSNETGKTLICREYSVKWRCGDEPYYPVNTADDRRKLELYRQEAAKIREVFFAGRLGLYKYYDMDKAVLAALELCDVL